MEQIKCKSTLNNIEYSKNNLVLDSIYFYYNSGDLDEIIRFSAKKGGYNKLNTKEKYYFGISLCQKYFLEDNGKFDFGLKILKLSCQEGDNNSCAYLNYYENIQFQKKYHYWEDLADKNSDVAMFFLGTNSIEGNPIFDTIYLKKSCDLGNVEACDKMAEYFNTYGNDEVKRAEYLFISDSLGSHNAKFNISLLKLNELIITKDSLLYDNFLDYFNIGKYSKYPEYIRYFEYGKILYRSNDIELKDLGERFIITSSTCGLTDAKDYMKINNILFDNNKTDIKISNFEVLLINSLKNYVDN